MDRKAHIEKLRSMKFEAPKKEEPKKEEPMEKLDKQLQDEGEQLGAKAPEMEELKKIQPAKKNKFKREPQPETKEQE